MPALTLACICPGDVNAEVCEVQSMTLNFAFTYTGGACPTNMVGATSFSNIHSSLGSEGLPGTTGVYAIALPLSWLAVWSTITIHLGFDASLFQTPPCFPGATFNWTWNIAVVFLCTDPVTGLVSQQTVYAINQSEGAGNCTDENNFVRSIIAGGPGAAAGAEFLSTPLGSCNGTSIDLGNFQPDPNLNTTINTGATSGDFCLCASGGTAPYAYSLISGQLPCGQTLNTSTGCIQGQPDGTCQGTGSVTFQVLDSTGATATVTCNIIPHCSSAGAIGNSFY